MSNIIKNFDYTAIFGMIFTFLFIFVAITMNSNLSIFLDVRSILIVVLGTLSITFTCFPFKDTQNFLKSLMCIFYRDRVPVNEFVIEVITIAEMMRYKGVAAVMEKRNLLYRHKILMKCIEMHNDNTEKEQIFKIAKESYLQVRMKYQSTIDVVSKMSEIAPAMGLIGTFIGLVQMLATLEDPSTIGPAMSVALLTTMYGAIISFAICNPIASKFRSLTKEEELFAQISIKCMESIYNKENPRRLESVINSMIEEKYNISYFD